MRNYVPHIMRVWLLTCFLVGVVGHSRVLAQKEVLYAQYQLNPMAINPAFAGVREDFSMTLAFRGRLFSFLNRSAGQIAAPITQTFAGDGQLGTGRFGLGLQVLNDRNSALGLGLICIGSNLSYRVDLPNLAKLYLGAQLGANILPITDLASSVNTSTVLLSYGAGLYYDAEKVFVGLSVPELGRSAKSLLGLPQFQVNHPIFAQLGGKFDLTDDLRLLPSVLLTQTEGYPLAYDLNAKIWYAQRAALGVSVRQNNVFYYKGPVSYVQASLDYNLSPNIRLGYTFNSTAPEAAPNSFQPQIHELIFRFTPNPNQLRFSYF